MRAALTSFERCVRTTWATHRGLSTCAAMASLAASITAGPGTPERVSSPLLLRKGCSTDGCSAQAGQQLESRVPCGAGRGCGRLQRRFAVLRRRSSQARPCFACTRMAHLTVWS